MLSIYDYLGIDNRYYVEKNIPLSLFFKGNRMTPKARAVVEKAVSSITVKYEITENNSHLSKVYTDNADFEELIVMEIMLYRKLDRKVLYNVSSYIFQTITYPLLLVLNVDNKEYQLYSFSFHKPILSQYNSVIDKRYATFWFSVNNMRECDITFFDEFKRAFDIKKADNIQDLFIKMCSVLPFHRKLVREFIEERKKTYYAFLSDDGKVIKREVANWFDLQHQYIERYSTPEDEYEAYCERTAERRFSDPKGRVDYSTYISYYGGYEYDDEE